MYCKKCGKFIGNDSDYCDECSVKETEAFEEFSEKKAEEVPPVYNYVPTPAPTYNGSDEIKLGKAIAAMILSELGFWFIYFAITLWATMVDPYYDYTSVIICVLAGLPMCIISLVFGIQCIKNFKETSHFRNGKRIPVLILGICSVVMAGISLFLVFILLLCAALLI